MVYTGKNQAPAVTVTDEFGDIIPPEHYKVIYSDNKKCGKATAHVKIFADDQRYEGEGSADFYILPQKSVIKSLTAGKGRLTVKVQSQKASGAEYYLVNYRVKNTSKWYSKKFKTTKGTGLVLKNLKKGKKYQVKVCAVTADGQTGAYSKTRTSAKIK